MNLFCENEGRRLFLYHLAQLFFHRDAEGLTLSAAVEGNLARVRLDGKGGSFEGKSPVITDVCTDRKRAESIALGLAFTEAARGLTSYRPPYGTLVGVRPVKVPVADLRAGLDSREVLRRLRERYAVSPEKASLLLDLARVEIDFAEKFPSDSVMLYISIPFCPSRCSYCSFISSAAPRHLAMIPRYLVLLEKELEAVGSLLKKRNKRIRALYVGGGTPGILTAEQMDSLLEKVHREFDLSLCEEICVEIGRPDTVSEEKLAVLQKNGVNRISINPQTTCNETLRRIGRGHSAEDFFSAMELAKKFPFSVNCDLISALPGESPERFLQSVEEVLALSPENVTLHALCNKRSSRERAADPSPLFAEAVEQVHKSCINRGWRPYYLYRQKEAAADLENVGFAKEGHLGLYNLAMMEDLCHVLACGAGGISKIVPANSGGRIRRFANHKYPFEYELHPEKITENLRQIESLL
ncbi:MAG: coproporphyrinogen dehydrogenase HemZ [Clostridia bacterium]|nr:coproporphyrinogen dehydrogenase HemZ [Clostridia bacterium]